MKSKILKIICPLFQLKAILLGIAIFNFVTTYIDAKNAEKYHHCFGGPWYLSDRFVYFPLYLLIATLGLFIRKWWSMTTAVLFAGMIIEQCIAYHIRLANPNPAANSAFIIELETVQDHIMFEPGLTFQFALAIMVFTLAIIPLVRKVLEK